MSLLPSEPDTSAAEEADPRVIGVDSDDADDVLSALSSETARELLSELHRDPAPPAEVADRVGTSLQNAQYHIEKLEDAGAIEVIDTVYSEKGREMNVYAPADRPLVIFAGDEDQSTGIRAALSRLLGSLGILALASLVVQALYGQGILNTGSAPAPGATGGEDGGGAPAPGAGAAAGNESTTVQSDIAARANGTDGGGGFQVADAPNTTQETAPTAVTESTKSTATATELPATTGAPEATTGAPEATKTAAAGPSATDGGAATGNVTDAATRTATETATSVAGNASDAAGQGLDLAAAFAEPGLLFFLGGATALCVGAAIWYATG